GVQLPDDRTSACEEPTDLVAPRSAGAGGGAAMTIEAKLVTRDDGTLALVAPKPAYWRGAPKKGAIIVPGASLGLLEVLGALEPIVAPKAVAGRVVEVFEPKVARRAVDAATVLL